MSGQMYGRFLDDDEDDVGDGKMEENTGWEGA